MPKPKPDPYAALRPIVAQLATLTHDELTDLCDMLRADAVTDSRLLPKRHGKPPVSPADNHTLILYGGWQYRRDPEAYTQPARVELQRAYADTRAQPPEARALIGDVAEALYRAHAPIEGRRRDATGQAIAGGNIQARYIYRNVLNRDTLEVERRAFGPYLYYRYWTTGGNHDKRGKRLASQYIGRQTFAAMFDATEPGSAERRDLEARIIEAHRAGTLDDLMLELGLQPDEPADSPPADDETD